MLTALVRKEILSLQADPRSPERGQYGFLQDLLRQVAYETMPRGERKARHLAAAAYLEAGWGPDDEEIAEVIAAHLLDAVRAGPERRRRRERSRRARANGSCAAASGLPALAAPEDAQRAFETAVELADDPLERAQLARASGCSRSCSRPSRCRRGPSPYRIRSLRRRRLDARPSQGRRRARRDAVPARRD